ncbi:Uncharacterized membrane protein HdeD, DUF308 family [Cryptosporangium aurantiacum]|uniref:Uncharacterized membrane protein HdeD, DUF308 family n=2 Tax=Cryptosporangium aurantiacum TaxID=134849 RepID=A0A1M7RFP0_9ACTN|nr:Uncharacterized membrane protein HdeD, DUF308 family [Cryptosporangium aurantiacum]
MVEAALGFLWIVLGVAVLAWPEATIRVVAVLLGLGLLAVGVIRVLLGLVAGRRLGSIVVGVVLAVGGVLCLADVATGKGALAFLVAALWVIDGAAELVLAVGARGSDRIWLFVVGGLTVVAGIAFLVWPQLSLASIVLTISIAAIVIGFCQIGFAASLRRSGA